MVLQALKPPEKLVVMGRVFAPFGVSGWIRIQPFTAAAESLLSYPAWWLGRGAEWRKHRIAGSQVQGRTVVAKLEGCDDRDAAAGFRGHEVAVLRDELPKTRENEYYWTDLIGLNVVNGDGEDFGRLVRILRTGANDVLVVEGARERLIPFIEKVIKEVDPAAGVIRVDWGADY
jgi:16S rRNA processing protein RimM